MKNLFLLFYNFFEDHIHLPRIKKFLNNNVILDRPIIIDIGSHKGKFIKLFNDLYKIQLVDSLSVKYVCCSLIDMKIGCLYVRYLLNYKNYHEYQNRN